VGVPVDRRSWFFICEPRLEFVDRVYILWNFISAETCSSVGEVHSERWGGGSRIVHGHEVMFDSFERDARASVRVALVGRFRRSQW
jgi:hypothetical protein